MISLVSRIQIPKINLKLQHEIFSIIKKKTNKATIKSHDIIYYKK